MAGRPTFAGAPFAMALSWFYELAPEGFSRDEEVAPESSIARQTGKRLDRAIIVVLSLAVVVLLANQFVMHRDASSTDTVRVPGKSIAPVPAKP